MICRCRILFDNSDIDINKDQQVILSEDFETDRTTDDLIALQESFFSAKIEDKGLDADLSGGQPCEDDDDVEEFDIDLTCTEPLPKKEVVKLFKEYVETMKKGNV